MAGTVSRGGGHLAAVAVSVLPTAKPTVRAVSFTIPVFVVVRDRRLGWLDGEKRR